jgi:hypothetical protein
VADVIAARTRAVQAGGIHGIHSKRRAWLHDEFAEQLVKQARCRTALSSDENLVSPL